MEKVSKEFKNVFKINIAIESENRLKFLQIWKFTYQDLNKQQLLLLFVLSNKTLKKNINLSHLKIFSKFFFIESVQIQMFQKKISPNKKLIERRKMLQ